MTHQVSPLQLRSSCVSRCTRFLSAQCLPTSLFQSLQISGRCQQNLKAAVSSSKFVFYKNQDELEKQMSALESCSFSPGQCFGRPPQGLITCLNEICRLCMCCLDFSYLCAEATLVLLRTFPQQCHPPGIRHLQVKSPPE